jgi:hypothetical protein
MKAVAPLGLPMAYCMVGMSVDPSIGRITPKAVVQVRLWLGIVIPGFPCVEYSVHRGQARQPGYTVGPSMTGGE